VAAPISRQETEVTDWTGLVSSAGTIAKTPAVAAHQVNLTAAVTGELKVRPGLREVRFDNEE
jgi:hypothetical protein